MNTITVVGSINIDEKIFLERFPKPGETLTSQKVEKDFGGKGANQAVASAKMGTNTFLIGAIGNDTTGESIRQYLNSEGVDTSKIFVENSVPTGKAFVMIDELGENRILLNAGANGCNIELVISESRSIIEQSDFLLVQLESDFKSELSALIMAKESNIVSVLNPAPMNVDSVLKMLPFVDLLIPNKSETEEICGFQIENEEDLNKAVNHLRFIGFKNFIITLGVEGILAVFGEKVFKMSGRKVLTVDTTCAGDTFIGALLSKLSKDFSNVHDAITFAQTAASLTVQKIGSMSSIPTFEQVELILSEQRRSKR